MWKNIIAVISIICVSVYHIESAGEDVPINPRTGKPYNTIKSPFKHCAALFNESDLGSDSGLQFIELGKYCDSPTHVSSFSMTKFRIVVLDEKVNIVASCKLKGQMNNRPVPGTRHLKSQSFFVIGDEGVKNVDMTFSECHIHHSYKGKFPHNPEFPYAIVLLWAPYENTLNLFDLIPDQMNGKTIYRKQEMYDLQWKSLFNHIQDMYILGSLTSYLNCKNFIKIYQDITPNPQYIIRDWSVPGEFGKSLSRCGQSLLPLNPESIKISVPTPGTRNLCRGATTLTLESILPLMKNPAVVDWLHGNICYSGTQPVNNKAAPLRSEDIENIYGFGIQNEVEVEIETENDFEDVYIEQEVQDTTCDSDRVEDNLYNSQDINDYKFEVHGLHQHQKYVNEDCNLYQRELNNIPSHDVDTSVLINNSSVCWWLDYKPAHGSIMASATCRICKILHTAGVLVDRPKSNENSKFITEGDWQSDAHRKRRHNLNLIHDHLDSQFHEISKQYFINFDSGKRGKDLFQAMMQKGQPYYQFFEATVNLALLVHTSVRMGLPFNRFGDLMTTQRYMTNNVGYVHHTKQGMVKMLGVISDCLRMELIHHLLTNSPKICLILDGSTSVSGHSNLAVLFQTWDSNESPRPVTYYYTLVHLRYGERGAGYFQVLLEQLERDKLTEFVKTNTIAMTADGASSMKYTYFEEMKNFVTNKNQFTYTHCYAHRLNLVIKSTMNKFIYFKYIDGQVNRLHSYFGRKASKKRLLLRENMVKYNVKEFALSRIFDERWVATRNRAYTRVQKHWSLVIDVLEQIIDGKKEFEPIDKKHALELKDDLTDPTFLLHLGFLIDVTDEHKPISLDFQRRNASLIGKYFLIKKLKSSMDTLRANGGTKLQEIVNQIYAADEQNEMPETIIEKLELIETQLSDYKETGLEPQKQNENRTLYKMWNDYYDDMALQIDNYFPSADFNNNFDIFYAPNFPQDLENNQNAAYGLVELTALNSKFSWHTYPTVLHTSFLKLIYSIVSGNMFSDKKNLHPEHFWYYYLQKNVEWTSELRNILRHLMTITPSSADAERTFSMVTATQTTGRYNLATSQIDKIIRIKINDEDNISRVNAFTYAKKFISKFCKADEMGRVKPKEKSEKKFDLAGNQFKTIFEKPYEDDNIT